jgi:ubiquinol-cytochrome c reductase iron-sulfur subunit
MIRRLLIALLVLAGFRRRRKEEREPKERIVPSAPSSRGAETAVIVLLAVAALSALAFVVFYAIGSLPGETQLLGLALGGAFAFVAAALIIASKRLVVTEENEEDYPEPGHPEERAAIAQVVEESADRLTRKRLLRLAGGAAGGAIGVALVTPAVSLGPIFDMSSLYATPWRRGRRLVDEVGRPFRATDIGEGTFYTAYPEGASHDKIAAPLVVVRVDPAQLDLPAGREGWAPEGIVAYSKICTHAGCAIALYRKPLFPRVEPRQALVCPCHYSTFDPAKGAKVLFGPAGRPLPQLPLLIDHRGELRAAGNFSGPVGPAWWGVRIGKPT